MNLLKVFGRITTFGLTFLSMANGGNVPFEELIDRSDKCYYWEAIHNENLFRMDADALYNSIAELNNEHLVDSSYRIQAMIIFSARLNNIRMDSDVLTRWVSGLEGTPDSRKDEDNLLHEVVFTLGAQGESGRNVLRELLSSEHLPIREAAFGGLLYYADKNSLNVIHDDVEEKEEELKAMIQEIPQVYKSDQERGLELSKEVAERSNFAPYAVGQLRDYLAYQNLNLSDGDWLDLVGRSRLIEMRSTATDTYDGEIGYLEESLTNKFFLGKLETIFSKAENRSERLKLENKLRDAYASSYEGNNIPFTPIFYLLGLELTGDEKTYLLSKTSISEEQMLPPGKIHTIDIDAEISAVPSPSKTVQAVTPPEPTIEEPAKVVTIEPAGELVEQSSQWWLWLVGALVVVGGFVVVVRRKS
ncbi:MAG: hypothetical protein CML13_05020 [Puniceicoccaceae bacterium]|nr:hypothetical protein [Puniceicoccaceae bacterium]|tara:strand:+ start:2352 stop:3602 length:1251 start_codon:yes stop_codon:yes gene_type:complete